MGKLMKLNFGKICNDSQKSLFERETRWLHEIKNCKYLFAYEDDKIKRYAGSEKRAAGRREQNNDFMQQLKKLAALVRRESQRDQKVRDRSYHHCHH